MTSQLQPLVEMAPPAVELESLGDGSSLVRSRQVLAPHARLLTDWLQRWATERPQQTFVAERTSGGEWRHCSYAEALARAQRIGQTLLDRGLGPERPLMVLSENSIDHAMLALGASWSGVPIVPVSVAYSLLSGDHGKLREIAKLVTPGLVFASDTSRYAAALRAIGQPGVSMAELLACEPGDRLRAAHAALGPDSIVKVLFTSGSTGTPKGVINTQRMITANQQQALQLWPFLAKTPPVVVDWLPWSHTFGGNFNFHMVLSHGGTLYIDAGKPMPGAIETTLSNLADVSPTMYFNVPRGFELLIPRLEQDAQLRRKFFSRCAVVFYAGAALPQTVWQSFARLAYSERQGDLALVSAWGSTETGPMATAVHFPTEGHGAIGLPVPGCEIKLLPNAGKLEARLRGPNITPGYWRNPRQTAEAFDADGYYRIGDALKFVDSERPEAGFRFDGRVAEDFKLITGTWVHVGALRLRLIEAAEGLIQDAVITGHDRAEAGALLFLDPGRCTGLSQDAIRRRIAEALGRLASADAGSSMRIRRALVLHEPPQLDAGEINDKGYLNQRAVLARREASVLQLYQEPAAADLIRPPEA